MESLIKLTQFKKLLNKREEGFSLIELVVVVSVLAVLAAIALPTFSCITRKAKATSALAAMKQIQTECIVKQEEEVVEERQAAATFVTSNLQGYEIESDGSNSCNGASETGLIRAIPNEPDQLPTFILATNNNELTYSFRGQTGTNFTDCLELMCERAETESELEPILLPEPEPITGCGPTCFEDENGACVCAQCEAYGPGMCGHPPCGAPMWEGTDYCPEQQPEQGVQVRYRNIYGGSGTPDDDWLGGYDGLPSGCRILRPGKKVWESCPSGCVRTPGGNGEGTCPPGSI